MVRSLKLVGLLAEPLLLSCNIALPVQCGRFIVCMFVFLSESAVVVRICLLLLTSLLCGVSQLFFFQAVLWGIASLAQWCLSKTFCSYCRVFYMFVCLLSVNR
ncbi:unnamed protein product [Discosporangium mesarthrocarpum]